VDFLPLIAQKPFTVGAVFVQVSHLFTRTSLLPNCYTACGRGPFFRPISRKILTTNITQIYDQHHTGASNPYFAGDCGPFFRPTSRSFRIS
jgi:hypothetical protein